MVLYVCLPSTTDDFQTIYCLLRGSVSSSVLNSKTDRLSSTAILPLCLLKTIDDSRGISTFVVVEVSSCLLAKVRSNDSQLELFSFPFRSTRTDDSQATFSIYSVEASTPPFSKVRTVFAHQKILSPSLSSRDNQDFLKSNPDSLRGRVYCSRLGSKISLFSKRILPFPFLDEDIAFRAMLSFPVFDFINSLFSK